jgi:hypothetical protein
VRRGLLRLRTHVDDLIEERDEACDLLAAIVDEGFLDEGIAGELGGTAFWERWGERIGAIVEAGARGRRRR